MRRLGWVGVVAAVGCLAWSGAARAQQATTLVEPPTPLLPQSFAGWHRDDSAAVPDMSFSLVNVNKDALEECAPQRSQTATYILKGRRVHVEAVEFNDATGAYSAFTLALRPGLKLGKEIGAATAIGDGGVLFETGSSLALAFPATSADVSDLTKLANTLPKIGGPRSQPPLLPTFFPAKGLATDSLRYALGPASYAAMGGMFAAGQLGWEKSAEAALATYADKRGKETLTLLLYPTPQIAADHTRAIEAQMANGVKARREGELVAIATGTFSADDAQNMIENIHLRTEVTFDRATPPSFEHEMQKTYSLLASIAIFCAVGTLASVLLGVFLGGGRALVRKMQGKDAVADVEFLSLHLEPQNPRPKMGPPAS